MAGTARAARGLTLIEGLVGLAMLAVLASLAVPSMGRYLAKTQLRAQAEQLALALSEARFEAARQGRPLHVAVEPGERWCWSVSAVPGCGCRVSEPCQQSRVSPARVQPVRIDDGLRLSFAPSADAWLQPSAINLSTAFGDRIQVRLTPMGRARVCAPHDAGGALPVC